MEQLVKYLHGVSKQEAWSKSLNYMKTVYGEFWLHKVSADENYWLHKQRVRKAALQTYYYDTRREKNQIQP